MASFLAAVEDENGDVTLPAHVRAEFERYLRCGLLSHGFVRVWCSTCKEDLLVGSRARAPTRNSDRGA